MIRCLKNLFMLYDVIRAGLKLIVRIACRWEHKFLSIFKVDVLMFSWIEMFCKVKRESIILLIAFVFITKTSLGTYLMSLYISERGSGSVACSDLHFRILSMLLISSSSASGSSFCLFALWSWLYKVLSVLPALHLRRCICIRRGGFLCCWWLLLCLPFFWNKSWSESWVKVASSVPGQELCVN